MLVCTLKRSTLGKQQFGAEKQPVVALMEECETSKNCINYISSTEESSKEALLFKNFIKLRLMPTKTFIDIIYDLLTLNLGANVLPDSWMHLFMYDVGTKHGINANCGFGHCGLAPVLTSGFPALAHTLCDGAA
ncbi:UNVERIFIED_CONTAM: hypothetical protein K2H54_065951 [Gekko kuhli]